jgi:hypothetical protein
MPNFTLKEVHRALRKVRTKLLNGTIESSGPKTLDMRAIAENRTCGSVCCIGGWAGLELGLEHHQVYLADLYDLDPTGRMSDLFYEFGDRKRTPRGAAGAITRYLETNQKVWR